MLSNPFGWSGLVALSLLHAPAWAADDAPLSADAAVALALLRHPSLQSADTNLQIARAERAGSALFLQNPTVQVWGSPDLARASLQASQPVSISGEGWHARAAARNAIQAADAELNRARRRVAADTRRAWADAAVATGSVQVALEGASLAERLSYAVTRLHEEGEASLLDLRLARLSQVQAAVRLLRARREQAEALRALAGWVLRPVEADDIASDPQLAAPEAVTTNDAERTDVIAARAAVASARAELARQRAAAIPPIGLGLGVQLEDGVVYAGPQLDVTLPVFDRNPRGRAEARGQLASAERSLASLEAVVATEQATATTRATEATELSKALGDDLLPEARAALTSVEAGVLAGEIDLSTAVLLQAQILDGELAIVSLRGLVADARIDLLLATDDDALLGGAP